MHFVANSFDINTVNLGFTTKYFDFPTPDHIIRNLLAFYFVLQHYKRMSGRQGCFRWPGKAIRPRPETHLTGARIAPSFLLSS